MRTTVHVHVHTCTHTMYVIVTVHITTAKQQCEDGEQKQRRMRIVEEELV